jgi:hypothetical protein
VPPERRAHSETFGTSENSKDIGISGFREVYSKAQK